MGDHAVRQQSAELSPSPNGWTETTLHSFGAVNDGSSAFGGVVFDSHGNLYGTTFNGGTGGGTVYQLQPSGSGWSYRVLLSLLGSEGPTATPTLDSAGNLFASTDADGSSFGNTFELSPGNNGWTYSDLHDFDGSDGSCPFGVLALDSSGNLYGTTFQGAEGGVAFEITPWGENLAILPCLYLPEIPPASVQILATSSLPSTSKH